MTTEARTRLIIAGIVAYALVAIVTFGHSAAYSDRQHRQEMNECRAGKREAFCEDIGMAPLAGAASALFWPLYWSWEAFA